MVQSAVPTVRASPTILQVPHADEYIDIRYWLHPRLSNWLYAPLEFKELRKKWRQEKKEAEEADRERDRAEQAQMMAMRDMQHQYAQHAPMAEYDHHGFVRRRMSMVEGPYPDPHAHTGPHSLPNHSYMHSAMQRQPSVSSFGGPQSAPAYGGLQGPGIGMDARYGLPSPADEVQPFRYPHSAHPSGQVLPSLSIPHHAQDEDMYYRQTTMQTQSDLVGPGWNSPVQHPAAMRGPPQFYNAAGSLTLPPPHSMSSLSVSAPNPSPLSGSAFPSLGPSTGPGPALGGADVNLGIAGAVAPGVDSGSATPELAAHVSLGSNRLPPDSTLLTPLPGYEPEGEQLDIDHRERSREREREYGRDDRDRAWGDRSGERDRYYASNGQGNGRERLYE